MLLSTEAQAPDVVTELAAAGARIYSVTRAARPLEEAYLELVREEESGSPHPGPLPYEGRGRAVS